MKLFVCHNCGRVILTIYSTQWKNSLKAGIECKNCKTLFTAKDIKEKS